MTITALQPAARPRILLPKAPVLVLDGLNFLCLTRDGELKPMAAAEARALVHQQMPIVCNAPHIAGRLNMERFPAFDVLELFAFVMPGVFCVPTPKGLARALGILEPATAEDQCLSLRDSIRHLLTDMGAPGRLEKSDPAALAAMMGLIGSEQATTQGWPWTPVVLSSLGRDDAPPTRTDIKAALKIWDKLPEWSVHAPAGPASHHGLDAAEVQGRLHRLLARQHKEERPEQVSYATELAHAFDPPTEQNAPHIIMAEAGTGVGKTLGYLSPATLWAEKNQGAVWVSTYTRNLQRQIDTELDKLYEDPVTKAARVVTRKGRENYLCLLNLEDITQSPAILMNEQSAVAAGLMMRWAAVTEDGDLAGKDFPGWLTGLIGWNRTHTFSDRRGECIYSACPHFNKCFVEKSIRKARRADIVIANHALVMHQTAISGGDDGCPTQETPPTRYIFDEGHHLFEAADSAFGAQLSGAETADLRRWLLGAEAVTGFGGQRSRARGIQRRIEDLIGESDEAKKELDDLIEAARCLPGPAWRQRLAEEKPKGIVENFLALCRQQVLARDVQKNTPYSLETAVQPAIPGLFEQAYALSLRLRDVQRPMLGLIKFFKNKLDDESATLDAEMRERLHFIITSLHRRANMVVGGWIDMLNALKSGHSEGCVDWLEITRVDGREEDIGFYRAYVDPARLFAEKLKQQAHGVVITSATLRDPSPEDVAGWRQPSRRAGVDAFDSGQNNTRLFHIASPFDYAEQTRIIVVKDVQKESIDSISAAFRELFTAAGGGALGIFTSIQRLSGVYESLMPALAARHLNLYAQHKDPLDVATLVDIFRDDENACLLGTDATRDGIDVPGRALRLVVYDRVPWPRPTLLHKARRDFFGKGYDDMLTRFKLKQAYGRLIRRQNDKGVFVMLDSAMPTRLTAAFPDGVSVHRVGLSDAIKMTKDFLD